MSQVAVPVEVIVQLKLEIVLVVELPVLQLTGGAAGVESRRAAAALWLQEVLVAAEEK